MLYEMMEDLINNKKNYNLKVKENCLMYKYFMIRSVGENQIEYLFPRTFSEAEVSKLMKYIYLLLERLRSDLIYLYFKRSMKAQIVMKINSQSNKEYEWVKIQESIMVLPKD